jgi:hypothetical protein
MPHNGTGLGEELVFEIRQLGTVAKFIVKKFIVYSVIKFISSC